MKQILIITLALILASCANNKQDEEFSPYPGGKCCEKKPQD